MRTPPLRTIRHQGACAHYTGPLPACRARGGSDSVPNCVGESFGGRRRPQHLADFRQIAGGHRALPEVTQTRWNPVRAMGWLTTIRGAGKMLAAGRPARVRVAGSPAAIER